MASSSSNTSDKKNDVVTFWDLNKCPPKNDGHLVKNINIGLGAINRSKKEMPVYRLSEDPGKRIATGDLSLLDPNVGHWLGRNGFQLINAKERYAYCDDHTEDERKPDAPSPDFALGSELLNFTIQSREVQPWNILLISNDRKFAITLDILHNGGYTTFLAHSADAHNNLQISAHFGYIWENMCIGASGLCHYNPPTWIVPL